MAKRRSNRYEAARSHYVIAKPRLSVSVHRLPVLSLLSDRRLYSPEAYRPADYSGLRLNRGLALKPSRSSRFKSAAFMPRDVLTFKVPERVDLCARRSVRKEVLFAKGRVGKGSARGRRRRNEHSEVSC